MNVLIVGASGLAGSYLSKEFKRKHVTFGTYFKHPQKGFIYLALQDKSSIKNSINKLRPDVLVVTAATSNVDFCELHPKETSRINVLGFKNLLDVASVQKEKPYIVFFSSDYVFDGRNGPHTEDDIPNPINEYGRQKLAGEELLKQYEGDHLIVRTTVLYGWEREGKNFVANLIDIAKTTRKSRSVPTDQLGSPTYAWNLAEVLVDLIEKRIKGVINVVGDDLLTRYEFAKKVIKTFHLPEEIVVPVSSIELNQPAKRPLKGGLVNARVKQFTTVEILNTDQGLKKMRSEKV